MQQSAAGYTAENIDNAFYNARHTAQACGKNPITPHINSEATAQDMDLLRGLLGDPKLNYIGYSYGTWLGAWYASRFPERVGRMVLDSSFDFTDRMETSFVMQPMARQRLLDAVLLPYAIRHPDYFDLGRTLAAAQAVLPSLSARMQDVLADFLSELKERRDADKILTSIAAARALDGLLQAWPNGTSEPIESALARTRFHPSDAQRDEALRIHARTLYAEYDKRWLNPPGAKSLSLAPGEATYWATRCNDTRATTDPQYWTDLGRDAAQRYPMFFAALLVNPCTFWGGPSVTKPDLSAMQGLDVLMVQSPYDAAAPAEGANRSFAALPHAYRVEIPGEYQHGVYPYSDSCVDTLVTRYLLGDNPSTRETSCPAHPLPRDAAQGDAVWVGALGQLSHQAWTPRAP